MLKKIALTVGMFGALAVAAPTVLACPNMDKERNEAPKTAEKDKQKDTEKTAPKKDDKKKDADKTKDGDKVSMK